MPSATMAQAQGHVHQPCWPIVGPPTIEHPYSCRLPCCRSGVGHELQASMLNKWCVCCAVATGYDCANMAVLLPSTNRTCRFFQPNWQNPACQFSGPSVVLSANGAALQRLWSSLGSPPSLDWPPSNYTISSSIPAPGPAARGDPCTGAWPGVTCTGSNITGVNTTGGTWMSMDIFSNMRTNLPNVTQLSIQVSHSAWRQGPCRALSHGTLSCTADASRS
jgi:hypothetical protein